MRNCVFYFFGAWKCVSSESKSPWRSVKVLKISISQSQLQEWKFWKFSFFKVVVLDVCQWEVVFFFYVFADWKCVFSESKSPWRRVKVLKISISQSQLREWKYWKFSFFRVVVFDVSHHLIFINKTKISNSNDTTNYHFLRFGRLKKRFLHIENSFKKSENFYISKSCLVWFFMWATICSSKIK
jgi:hypothetical protein